MQSKQELKEKRIKFLEKMEDFIQTYLLLKPRFTDVPTAENGHCIFLHVEGVLAGVESFDLKVNDDDYGYKDNQYIKGYAFDIESCTDEQEELRKIGTIEGVFYDFDRIKADGVNFNDAFVGVRESTYDAFEAMGIPESLTKKGEGKCLNIFAIEDFSLELDHRCHGIGTVVIRSLIDAISYHFNRRIGILLVSPNSMIPKGPKGWAPWDGPLPDGFEENRTITHKRLENFFERQGFRSILEQRFLHFKAQSAMSGQIGE